MCYLDLIDTNILLCCLSFFLKYIKVNADIDDIHL